VSSFLQSIPCSRLTAPPPPLPEPSRPPASSTQAPGLPLHDRPQRLRPKPHVKQNVPESADPATARAGNRPATPSNMQKRDPPPDMAPDALSREPLPLSSIPLLSSRPSYPHTSQSRPSEQETPSRQHCWGALPPPHFVRHQGPCDQVCHPGAIVHPSGGIIPCSGQNTRRRNACRPAAC
jgi:hypothetical protein